MGKTEETVKLRIKDLYGNVAQFSKQTGIPYSTVNNALNRGLGGSGIDTILPICRALGLDPMSLGSESTRILEYSDPDYIDVPLRGRVPAGEPVEMCPVDDYFPVPRQVMEREPGSFLLEVSGESMNKVLPRYSYALVNPNKTEVVDDEVYAVNVNGHDSTVKRVRRLNNGLELVPDSTDPTFQPKTYDFGRPETEGIRIIGKVVWLTFPFDYVMKK
ncbi:MAG: hypothetical protein LBL86_12060 [Coriobacteriales bacterium]|jgi:repressor LexA|nr:hypothetical protein [Coriobacteriales bacterium]